MALAFLVGVVWFATIILYGMGAYRLGHLGTSVGWAVNVSASLIVANMLGFTKGESKGTPTVSVKWILAGLTLLVTAMAALGYENGMFVRS